MVVGCRLLVVGCWLYSWGIFSLFTIHFSLFIKRRKLTRLWLVRHFQNLSRITLMRRICSFTDFYCVVGFLCACRAQWLSRIISYWRNPAPYRRKYNPKEILYNIQDQIKEIREKIKSVASVIRELFERVRTEPKAKEHNNVVLSSRQLSSP